MNISIAFSGPAGSGINTCGTVLGNLLSEYGYFVYGDKQYSSLIKGGNNIFVLYISDSGPYISNTIDHYLYFDAFALGKNSSIYDIKTQYFIDKKQFKNQNSYALGLVTKLLWIDMEAIESAFLGRLPEVARELNRGFLLSGYTLVAEPVVRLKSVSLPKKFMFGNEAIAKWAMDSGLEFYSAYPMTPASSLIDVISHDSRVIFFQWEDEIAVAMSMLGAKFAGKRSMCGTSGGGFALMSESISFSNQAELGGVYVFSQRAGPSTGTPTFTGQWDLNYALNASFGDTFPIVVAPYTFVNGYSLIGKSLNWSDMYQHPVVFLIDKSFSESYMSVDTSQLLAETVHRGKLVTEPHESFVRYAVTDDGISGYTVPGTPNGEFIATSYEHDIYGKETEDESIKIEMENQRFLKMETFVKNEFGYGFSGFDIVNPGASKFFVTYGINYYGISGYTQGHLDENWGIILLKVIQPLDPGLKIFLDAHTESIDRLVFIEQNQSGQLETYLIPRLGLLRDRWDGKISHVRSQSFYPIFPESLWETV